MNFDNKLGLVGLLSLKLKMITRMGEKRLSLYLYIQNG